MPQPEQAPIMNQNPHQEEIAVSVPDRSNPPPIPPMGLPEGWTEEQWNAYGWQYIDALST